MNSTRLGSLAHTLLQRAPATAALVLAVLAGATAYVAVRRQEEEVRRGWTLMPVVVANQELSLGRALTADALAERQVPEQFVTSSTVKPDAVNHVLGQRLRVPLQKGDMLLWSQLESGRETERLSGKVMKKARAVTIEAGPTASVGGWVRPNDHVDVIGTFRDPQNQDPVAVTLLENVVVLATGKTTGTASGPPGQDASRDYSHVSLLVVPEEAEMLVLAADLGSLSLSLRNPDDLDTLDERGRADIRALLSGRRTYDLQQRRMRTVQIIKGAAVAGESLGGEER